MRILSTDPALRLNASTAIRHDMSSATALACQICFEEARITAQQEDDEGVVPSMVTRFCSARCPAAICLSCLERHLHEALKVSYAGALPRVCCPICLVQVNKHQWGRFLDADSVEDNAIRSEYRSLCEKSCSFTCPGCHSDDYVHLPGYYEDKGTTVVARVPKLLPSQRALIPALRRSVRRFCRHRKDTSARDVVQYIADRFSKGKVARLVQAVLQRIQDEERRATLLITYHRVYRATTTHCCGVGVCFNCKRTVYKNDNYVCKCEGLGEHEMLGEDDWVQCRFCRATLVKVEGCNTVQCPCNFSMKWDRELQFKDLHRRNLLPVDPFDLHLFEAWHGQLLAINFAQLRASVKLRALAKTRPDLLAALRRVVWRRRFRKLIVAAEQQLRVQFVDRTCRGAPILLEALRTLIWRRRRFHRRLLAECRVAFVRHAARSRAMMLHPLLIKCVWHCRFRLVLGSLLRHFYVASMGWGNLSEEQQEQEEDELSMFSIGLN
ncbi:hypothetical protein BBJ28_00011116 [Nothophytophthora sp. Chile5]|nr:hypothetical protein BBJ28_00011116 [Nothophytophthora sp. Chile5]